MSDRRDESDAGRNEPDAERRCGNTERDQDVDERPEDSEADEDDDVDTQADPPSTSRWAWRSTLNTDQHTTRDAGQVSGSDHGSNQSARKRTRESREQTGRATDWSRWRSRKRESAQTGGPTDHSDSRPDQCDTAMESGALRSSGDAGRVDSGESGAPGASSGTTFELYSSTGEPLAQTGTDTRQDASVGRHFDDDVQVAIRRHPDDDDLEITAAVRARRSQHGRLNSHYVRFVLDSLAETDTVRRDLHRFLTEEAGLYLTTDDAEGADVVHHVWSVEPRFHLDEAIVDDLERLSGETEEPIELVVPDGRIGLEVGFALLEADIVSSMVMVEGDRHHQTGEFEAVLRIVDRAEVGPASSTREALSARRERWAAERIDDHLEAIEEEINTLRHQTPLTDRELRRRVIERLPSRGGDRGAGGLLGALVSTWDDSGPRSDRSPLIQGPLVRLGVIITMGGIAGVVWWLFDSPFGRLVSWLSGIPLRVTVSSPDIVTTAVGSVLVVVGALLLIALLMWRRSGEDRGDDAWTE